MGTLFVFQQKYILQQDILSERYVFGLFNSLSQRLIEFYSSL